MLILLICNAIRGRLYAIVCLDQTVLLEEVVNWEDGIKQNMKRFWEGIVASLAQEFCN